MTEVNAAHPLLSEREAQLLHRLQRLLRLLLHLPPPHLLLQKERSNLNKENSNPSCLR